MWTGMKTNSPRRKRPLKAFRPHPSGGCGSPSQYIKTNGQILDELLTKWEEMGYRFESLDHLTAQSAR